MLSTWLVEHADLARVGLALAVVAASGLAAVLLRGGRRGRRAAGVLALLSLAPVALLTLTPTARDLDGAPWCTVQVSLPSLGAVEALANIALFVPVVLFAAVALGRPLVALLLGAGTSLALEMVQAVVRGLGRACDTQDWVMNAAGSLVAATIAACLMGALGRGSSGRIQDDRRTVPLEPRRRG